MHGARVLDGMVCAQPRAMAKRVDELLVYQKALAAAGELFALIERTALRKDCDLASQLNAASLRVVSDIAEGFEQKTDRHFARYLYDARGSTREIRTQLEVGIQRRRVQPEDVAAIESRYEEVGKLLSGLIDYLRRSDWKDRGRHGNG